ncbi:MAG: exopolysaccharide Pel transporter PelG [Verrucomicrobiales bacterium]|nr:exopolysaccharide Pel transporter PelG [Verrucomicrobiales bacterium]
MAGIGFELEKYLRPRTYSGTAQAHFHSALFSCGPWIISIVSIAVLNLMLRNEIGQAERTLFSSVVTHAYAIALLITGGSQFILTRHSADFIFGKRKELLLPTCISAMTLVGLISFVVGLVVFGLLCTGSILFKMGAISLTVFVSLIFVGANYLGSLQKYKGVVSGYALGYVVSCFAGWITAVNFGIEAAVLSFALGHFVLLVSILYLLCGEAEGDNSLGDWGFLSYFRKFPELAICGFFYNFGVWGDKILFWWLAHDSQQINGVLRAAPNYDMAIYLSLLSIVPGFSVFFLALETRFAPNLSKLSEAISSGGSLDAIERGKANIIGSLQEGFNKLFAVQGFTTAILLILSEPIGAFLSIGALQVGIFQVTLIGAFLLIVFLSMLTVLFYFDDRKGAMWSAVVFGLGNVILSYSSLLASEAFYGLGFVLSAAAAVTIASFRLNGRIRNLEYSIFHH